MTTIHGAGPAVLLLAALLLVSVLAAGCAGTAERAPATTARTVSALPGGTGMPGDADGDGRREDVNGNGRSDFADVVLFFNAMEWIAANEPVAAFDYNANGRTDFADVTWLFGRV